MKTAIIVIIILAVIAGIYFYLKAGKKQEEGLTAKPPGRITTVTKTAPIGVSSQFLEAVAIKNATEQFKADMAKPNIFGGGTRFQRPSAYISMI